jgi:hypothetical protein
VSVLVAERFEQPLPRLVRELGIACLLRIGRVREFDLSGEVDDGADLMEVAAAVSTDGAVDPHAQALTTDDVTVEVFADFARKFFTR